MSQIGTKRTYVPEWDEDGVAYLWISDQCRSRAAAKRGADVRGSEAQRAYWREVSPLVTWLLSSVDVEVVCDPERVEPRDGQPAIIYGFAATSGDVVHGVVVKRDTIKFGFGGEVVRTLLGERMKRECPYTMELVQLGMRGSKPLREQLDGPEARTGVPRGWFWDGLWLPRHYERRAA